MHPVGACIWNSEMQQMQSSEPFRWWPILQAALQRVHLPIELVIHSTWRLMWETDEELLSMLPLSMRPYVRGATDRACMGRESSILQYVAKNKIDHFLVLDDEAAAFAANYAPLIICDGRLGLSQPGIAAALNERMARWSLMEWSHVAP